MGFGMLQGKAQRLLVLFPQRNPAPAVTISLPRLGVHSIFAAFQGLDLSRYSVV